MFLTRNDYDRGVNTFSPEGRLFQVEYAMEAIKLGSTAIGIATSNGVLLAVEKRSTSPLIETDSIEKIVEIDSHIIAALSGLTADSRTIIEAARTESLNHTFLYAEKIRVESLAQSICDLALRFGENGEKQIMSRPFGVALLIAGVDDDGRASLWHCDPSGTLTRYHAKAIGAGSEGAQTTLQDEIVLQENESSMMVEDEAVGMSQFSSKKVKNITLENAEAIALKILKQVMEEKLTASNIQLASVDKTGMKIYNLEAVEALVSKHLSSEEK